MWCKLQEQGETLNHILVYICLSLYLANILKTAVKINSVNYRLTSSILEGMVRNTKFVFHIAQTQSKEGTVLDRHQFSVFEINHKLETKLKYLK